MSLLYLLLAPLAFFVLQKRISWVMHDIKTKNESKLKADILFLLLCLMLIGLLVWIIELG